MCYRQSPVCVLINCMILGSRRIRISTLTRSNFISKFSTEKLVFVLDVTESFEKTELFLTSAPSEL